MALRHEGIRFSAGLSNLFPDVPFLERFAEAARLGFEGVEYPAPYAYKPQVLRERLDAHGLKQVLFNVQVGSRQGDLGLACNPRHRAEFEDSVGLALEYAEALGCAQINCLSGYAPLDTPTELLHATYVANLQFAAKQAAALGVCIVIEPLNTFDYPDYFLKRTSQAAAIVAEVDMPNVRLEYDIYHAQMMEGRLACTLQDHIGIIRHIQFGDAPTRETPGSGEIRFDYILDVLKGLSYEGWIGCDYRPTEGMESLGWLSGWLGRQPQARYRDSETS